MTTWADKTSSPTKKVVRNVLTIVGAATLIAGLAAALVGGVWLAVVDAEFRFYFGAFAAVIAFSAFAQWVLED